MTRIKYLAIRSKLLSWKADARDCKANHVAGGILPTMPKSMKPILPSLSTSRLPANEQKSVTHLRGDRVSLLLNYNARYVSRNTFPMASKLKGLKYSPPLFHAKAVEQKGLASLSSEQCSGYPKIIITHLHGHLHGRWGTLSGTGTRYLAHLSALHPAGHLLLVAQPPSLSGKLLPGTPLSKPCRAIQIFRSIL